MLALSRQCKLLGLSLGQCCAGNGVLRLTGRFSLADVSTISPTFDTCRDRRVLSAGGSTWLLVSRTLPRVFRRVR